MLVVIAIVCVLIAMILPSLRQAKDHARTVKCQTLMKQQFVLAENFRADMRAILPAWYWPWRPTGPYEGENPGLGHPDFNWSMNYHSQMLIDYGYAPVGERGTTVAAQQVKLAMNSLFSCPDGLAVSGFSATTPMDDVKRAQVLRTSYSKTRAVQGAHYSGYAINMNFGSWQWYHNAYFNYGYYPVKELYHLRINAAGRKTNSTPSEVAYLMETNVFGVNENHTLTAYSKIHNSWGQGGLTYFPTARHKSLSSSNFIYFDGAFGTMREEHYSNGNPPFPFKWY